MSNRTVFFLSGVTLLVMGIVGYVVLYVAGGDAEGARGIFIFLTPVVSALFLAGIVKDDIGAIKRQTNGLHDTQLNDVANRAVAKANGHPIEES